MEVKPPLRLDLVLLSKRWNVIFYPFLTSVKSYFHWRSLLEKRSAVLRLSCPLRFMINLLGDPICVTSPPKSQAKKACQYKRIIKNKIIQNTLENANVCDNGCTCPGFLKPQKRVLSHLLSHCSRRPFTLRRSSL